MALLYLFSVVSLDHSWLVRFVDPVQSHAKMVLSVFLSTIGVFLYPCMCVIAKLWSAGECQGKSRDIPMISIWLILVIFE